MSEKSCEFLIWVSIVLCLLSVSVGFDPTDKYLIDCGSYNDTHVGDRLFVSDSSSSNLTKISTPLEILVSASSVSSLSSLYDRALYENARVLDGPSKYTFSIKKQGQHRIRLYFFPFVEGSYDLSMAKFSVTAQNVTLLKDYVQANGSVVKEFSLDITSSSLVLDFIPSSDSFAFVNALEVISLPDELIPVSVRLIGDLGDRQNLEKQALETVVRVNMGNQTVRPENDTLWRLWDADGPYLVANSMPIFESNVTAVNFTSSWPKDIAPSIVYGTATRLNWEWDSRMKANITWFFDVDPGFSYLVRFHLCDIVASVSPQMLAFNIYIDSLLAYEILDFGNLTSNVMGAPFYTDVVTEVTDSGTLIVSVGPSPTSDDPNGILSGIEIMKISNSKNSLAPSDGEFPSNPSSKVKNNLIVYLAIGLCSAVLVVVAFMFLICRRRRRRKLSHVSQAEDQDNNNSNGSAIFSSSKIGYRFPLVAIQEATDYFNESLVVGVGGFGKVFKGSFKDETKIAVKRGSPQSRQGITEFRTEIEMLSQFRHRHLVSLIGYCDQHNEMIIIYEYMINGTLKNHLYGSNIPSLTWKQRLEVCIGSARGLHYLHTGSAAPIIHRDVKSANILLDESFMAKVADFGLSKTGPLPEIDQTHVSTAVKGSFGYLDPEYLIRQQLTEKSDVYSFGVVMFEVICGRPVIDPSLPREQTNLVEWAMKWQKSGQLEQIIDPRLAGDAKEETVRKFGEIAEKCLAERGVDRPPMGDVLWNLEYVLQLQCSKERSKDDDDGLNSGRRAGGSCAAEFSLASVEEDDDDVVGVSMSKVFARMVRDEMV